MKQGLQIGLGILIAIGIVAWGGELLDKLIAKIYWTAITRLRLPMIFFWLAMIGLAQTQPRSSQIRNWYQVARGDGYFTVYGPYAGVWASYNAQHPPKNDGTLTFSATDWLAYVSQFPNLSHKFADGATFIGPSAFINNGGTMIRVEQLADHGLWVKDNVLFVLGGTGGVQQFTPMGPDAPIVYFWRGGLGGQSGFGVPGWSTRIFKEVTSAGGWAEGSLGMNGTTELADPSCPPEAILSVLGGQVSITMILPRVSCK